MQKIKWTLMSAAILLGIGGAFATRPHFDCSNMTQYIYTGGGYLPAGTEGVNYVCAAGSGTCTYYTTNGINFFPCQAGTYCTSNCFVRQDGQPLKPLKPATIPANTQTSH